MVSEYSINWEYKDLESKQKFEIKNIPTMDQCLYNKAKRKKDFCNKVKVSNRIPAIKAILKANDDILITYGKELESN